MVHRHHVVARPTYMHHEMVLHHPFHAPCSGIGLLHAVGLTPADIGAEHCNVLAHAKVLSVAAAHVRHHSPRRQSIDELTHTRPDGKPVSMSHSTGTVLPECNLDNYNL